MDVREFAFILPPELVAQEPPQVRGSSRLLHLDRRSGARTHTSIDRLSTFLDPGDVVVVNNSRVFPARLIGRRDPSGGAVECLLVSRLPGEDLGSSERWQALMHPGQKLGLGARVVFGTEAVGILYGEVLERHFHGRRTIRLWTEDGRTVLDVVDAIGHMPLPPYIKRADRAEDRDRYQTVFARERGSIAAPTAGLHLTGQILESLAARGVQVVEITLHVGYGTFQPVRVERVEDHNLEREHYNVPHAAALAIEAARNNGRRILAVGTTTTRTLEAVARANAGHIVSGSGTTDLFIYPGFEFRVVNGLLTNFHLPASSLIMLVAAFAGRDALMSAYADAIAHRYRFYSYGDAMLVT
ncbi:MAG TPA: tRNA preQ1(34) S-adenosylmethionine ribosyltransferase-isomerase QueA [Vicinamibacterales bacterium]|nr:tRNA preQ1(34) S-adenosylmethionine ribosyltransferase-isomerase QueA [Vicinamibacterales bacterium]